MLLLDDFHDLIVHCGGCALTAGQAGIAAQVGVVHGFQGNHVKVVGHAVAGNHGAGHLGGLLNIVGCAGGDGVEHHFFGGTATGHGGNFGQDLFLGHQGVVAVLYLHGETQRAGSARYNGDFLHGGGMALQGGNHGMADFVVGHDALFFVAQDLILFLGTGQDGIHGFLQVVLGNGHAVVAHSAQGGFVDDIGQLGTGSTGSHAGNHGKVTVGADFDLLSVQAQDAFAAFQVGQLHGHTTVKTAGAGQSGVKGFRTVGGGQNDNTLSGVKPVHFGQQLVQSLLAFIVAAHTGSTVTLFANGIDLINKDNAGGFFVGLFEEVTHLGSAHADEHLDKFRTRNGEERNTGFAGNSAGQQGFTGARGADKQNALGHFGTDILVTLGVMQEVNDFLQALFGFVLTGNIGKFDGLAILNDILFGTGFAAAKNHAVGAAGHFTDPLAHHAVEPDDQDDHGQQRDDPAQQGIHPGGLVVHLAKGNAGAFQPVDQLQVLRNGVGAVGGIVFVHKIDLLILNFNGAQFAAFEHVQEGAVIDLFDLAFHHGGEGPEIEQQQHHKDHGIYNAGRLFGVARLLGFVHNNSSSWGR